MEGFKIITKNFSQYIIKHMRAKCCNKHSEFIIRLEQNKGFWYMVYATKLEKFSKNSSSSYTNNELKLDKGLYVGDNYECPYCGNRSIIRCGKCGHITCNDGGKYFKCDYCDYTGEIGGTIMSIYVEEQSVYTKK